jgi:hypothetical protein
MSLRFFRVLFFAGIISIGLAVARGPAQDTTQSHPAAHTSSSSDHDAMLDRGDEGMGFLQTKTTHHFLLKRDGGVISVSANDPKDSSTRQRIRVHLEHAAHAFSQGDFDIPMFVHDQVPPGAPEMKRLTSRIRYCFTDTEAGGQVSISSHSPDAVTAIHNFLAFQIREHGTGDPVPGKD